MKKIVLLLLLVPFLSYGQQPYNQKNISELTNEIVKEIEKTNKLIRDYSGNDIRNKLKEIVSKEELIELTNHPNGVVRCNAFWTLSHDKSVDLLPIILNHIEDDELITTIDDDLIWHEMVGDFFINVVTPRYIDLKSTKLDIMQRATLDSMLIYSNSKLEAKQEAILNAKPTESLYPLIKELYVKENNQSALVTLAKYRKQGDIQLILENKYKYDNEEGEEENEYTYEYGYTYKAIQEFPHNDFLPLLEKKINETLDNDFLECKELYKAISAYKNEKAVEMLSIPLTQVQDVYDRKYHIDLIYNAIQKNIAEIYDSLLWKLWNEENRITPDIFQYLIGKDSIKVLEITKKSIANPTKIDYLENYTSDLDTEESMILIMLNFILKNDYEFGLEIIKKNIINISVHQISILTDKVIELKDKSFIEPLFERFAEEWNAHVYLAIAKALLSYQDDAINNRILEIRKINDNLNKGWGSEDLDELLNKINQITKSTNK